MNTSDVPLCTFGLFADVQYADKEAFQGRTYRTSLSRLEACLNHLTCQPLDFLVNLGDLIDEGIENLAAPLAMLRRFSKPVVHVAGNHDFDVDPRFHSCVRVALNLSPSYHAFFVPGYRFIVLNGFYMNTLTWNHDDLEHLLSLDMLQQLQADKAPQAQTYNGGLGISQLRWLEYQLVEAEMCNEHVIVLCHFPLFPADKHVIWDHSETARVLALHRPPVAWFNGHNHAGNYAQSGQTHFFTLPGMIEADDQQAFSVVHLYPRRFKIEGIGLHARFSREYPIPG